MKFIADTSAILSLKCSRYFDIVMSGNNIIITPSVYEELKQFARYIDTLGLMASEIIKRKLKIKKPKIITSLGLEKAEEEVFSAAKEEKCIALTDDIHAARIAKEKLKLDTKPSLYLLLLLYKKHKIKKEELIDDIKSLLKYRNWLSGTLWEYAMDVIDEI